MLWCSPAMPQIVPRQVLESTRLNSRKPLQSEEATTPLRSGLLEQTIATEWRGRSVLNAMVIGRHRLNRSVRTHGLIQSRETINIQPFEIRRFPPQMAEILPAPRAGLNRV